MRGGPDKGGIRPAVTRPPAVEEKKLVVVAKSKDLWAKYSLYTALLGLAYPKRGIFGIVL